MASKSVRIRRKEPEQNAFQAELQGMKDENGNLLLSADQMEKLIGLVDEGNYDLQLEIISLLYQYDPEYVIEHIERPGGVWETSLFDADKNRELAKQESFLDRKKAVKGLGKCERCGGTEMFSGESKQTRSADEGTTVTLICRFCLHKQYRG